MQSNKLTSHFSSHSTVVVNNEFVLPKSIPHVDVDNVLLTSTELDNYSTLSPASKKIASYYFHQYSINDPKFEDKFNIISQKQWIKVFEDIKYLKTFIIDASQGYFKYLSFMRKNNPRKTIGILTEKEYNTFMSKCINNHTVEQNYELLYQYYCAVMYFRRVIPKRSPKKLSSMRYFENGVLSKEIGIECTYHGTFGNKLILSSYTQVYPICNDLHWNNEKIWFKLYPKVNIDINSDKVLTTFCNLYRECQKTINSKLVTELKYKDKVAAKDLKEKLDGELNTFLSQYEAVDWKCNDKLKTLTMGNSSWFRMSLIKPTNYINEKETERSIVILFNDINETNLVEKDNYMHDILGYLQFSLSKRYGKNIFALKYDKLDALTAFGVELIRSIEKVDLVPNIEVILNDLKVFMKTYKDDINTLSAAINTAYSFIYYSIQATISIPDEGYDNYKTCVKVAFDILKDNKHDIDDVYAYVLGLPSTKSCIVLNTKKHMILLINRKLRKLIKKAEEKEILNDDEKMVLQLKERYFSFFNSTLIAEDGKKQLQIMSC